MVPTGIYTDLGTKQLREMLLTEGQIQYMFNFSNERFFFNDVDHRFQFTLLGVQRGEQSDGFWATFRFNPRVAVEPDGLPAFLADESNLIYVRRDSLALFSPDSLSVMEFQTPTDYQIAEKIYNDWPLIGQTVADLWNPELAQEFHMANDSHLFNQARLGFVLYEGKMVHQFDPYFGEPRYWIEESLGQERLASKTKGSDWFRGYRFTFRAIASATNERTLIAAVLPPHNFTGHSLWVGVTPDLKTTLYFVALLNSFCVDWLTRFKVYTNVTLFAIKQLPLPRLTAGNPYFEAMVLRAARLTCTTADFAELWQTVMGTPWSSAGESSAGPATDPATRQQVRDELDGLVAHLYNLSRLEFEHLLDTFPLIFPDTPDGRARKEILLRVYDRVGDGF